VDKDPTASRVAGAECFSECSPDAPSRRGGGAGGLYVRDI
jgi:hypothetical protein